MRKETKEERNCHFRIKMEIEVIRKVTTTENQISNIEPRLETVMENAEGQDSGSKGDGYEEREETKTVQK